MSNGSSQSVVDELPSQSSTTIAASKPKSTSLSRTSVNFLLDTALLVTFLTFIFVSVVVRFVFPPAISAENWTLWSLSLDQWLDIQFGFLGLLSLGILVHLMLHWSWVCGVISKRFLRDKHGKRKQLDTGTQTIFGVGLMIVLLNIVGLGIAVAALSIQGPS